MTLTVHVSVPGAFFGVLRHNGREIAWHRFTWNAALQRRMVLKDSNRYESMKASVLGGYIVS